MGNARTLYCYFIIVKKTRNPGKKQPMAGGLLKITMKLIRMLVISIQKEGIIGMCGSTGPSGQSRSTGDSMSQPWQGTTEDQAERELARLRWSDGCACPFCGSADTYALTLRTVKRRRYKCRSCRRQFSVTKGTILEGSKLSLVSWIRLVQMLCERDADVSIGAVSRRLNVSYGAARNALDRLIYAARREPFSSMLREPDDR